MYGSRCTAPFILNLGTRWMHVVNFVPQLLYAQKLTLLPTEGPQSWSGHFGQEKSHLSILELEPQAIQSVA
jgi:hypothetical protein